MSQKPFPVTASFASWLALASGCGLLMAGSGCQSAPARPAAVRYGADPRRPAAPAAEHEPGAASPADDLVEQEAGQMAIEDQQRAEQATKAQETAQPRRRFRDSPLRRE